MSTPSPWLRPARYRTSDGIHVDEFTGQARYNGKLYDSHAEAFKAMLEAKGLLESSGKREGQ